MDTNESDIDILQNRVGAIEVVLRYMCANMTNSDRARLLHDVDNELQGFAKTSHTSAQILDFATSLITTKP